MRMSIGGSPLPATAPYGMGGGGFLIPPSLGEAGAGDVVAGYFRLSPYPYGGGWFLVH